jgi:hypothetical protein
MMPKVVRGDEGEMEDERGMKDDGEMKDEGR